MTRTIIAYGGAWTGQKVAEVVVRTSTKLQRLACELDFAPTGRSRIFALSKSKPMLLEPEKDDDTVW